MILFAGMVIVDSRDFTDNQFKPKTLKLIDFRFNSKPYLEFNDYVDLCNKIKSIYNPMNMSMDDAVKWMLQNKPYSSHQTEARVIRVLSPYYLLASSKEIDTENSEYEQS